MALLIILIITTSSISVALVERNKFYSRQLYLQEIKADNDLFSSTGAIYNILDDLIAQYINEDRIFNPYSIDDYLPEEEQNRIVKDVTTKIIEEMSPILYNQLSCYFDKDKIMDVITRRVLVIVIGLTAEVNNNVKIKNTTPEPEYNKDLNRIINNLY